MRIARTVGGVCTAACAVLAAMALGLAGCTEDKPRAAAGEPSNSAPGGAPGAASGATAAGNAATDVVHLKDSQVGALKIAALGIQSFKIERHAVGTIDFNENEAVQSYPPYAGRIMQVFADLGDDVKKGKPLYTIDSPDLLQAESTLITDAGVAALTSAALARAKDLYEHEGMAQKDYQQAVSDQMSAEGALKTARDGVRVFGKSDAEIDAIIARRKADPALVVVSPVTGRVTARNAQPGLYVQPGTPPAPVAVADLSKLWMIANVPELDIAALRTGQSLTVTVMALGNEEFKGTVKAVGSSLDPNTHTAVVRAEVEDPERRLTPGMMATYSIDTGSPEESVAIPVNGIVREGDGSMSAWVTADHHTFTRRTVTIGLQENGFDQVLTGLSAGETAVVDGAILLSNILYGSSGDE